MKARNAKLKSKKILVELYLYLSLIIVSTFPHRVVIWNIVIKYVHVSVSLLPEYVHMNILPEFDTESGFLRNLRSV